VDTPKPEPELAPAPRPGGTIPVIVEEGMADVVPDYLDRRRADLPIYRQALEAGDFDSIKKMAHKTKGTGSGYGFPGLTELGGALEQAAIRTDITVVSEKLSEYADYLERVELQYSKR
jgi:HPt (histidine-containing phosphotransfer) domain-containing protein